MVDFISSNWGVLLGGGSATGLLGWIFYGRKNNNAEFTAKVQGIYDNLVDDLKKDREFLKSENAQLKAERTIDKEYFRSEIDKSDKKISTLQEQFNHLNLAYTLEVEKSQNWEKLHYELTKKYELLEKENEKLKKRVTFLEKCRLENKDCKINLK